MARPVILAVDDEPQVLSAVARDLRQQYGREYRIVRASSGAEALSTTQQLKQRNEPIALFLADQRMPNMTGAEFLAETLPLYPDAKKVLLTAYADTEVAITSINTIGLDHYLMKPWHPPEEHLYPVLDGLLNDWAATVPLPYDGIRVAGTRWSASCHNAKDFLSRNQIPYQWLDIEKDSEAAALVDTTCEGTRRLPVVFFPDGETLIDPDHRTLADKAGLRTQAEQPFYDLVIIGAGPAGLAAAVYGAAEGLRTIVVEKEAPGGQAGTSARIENYLGFPSGVSGADLTRRAIAQVERLGSEILTAQEATKVRVEDPYRYVTLGDGSELACKAVLIATGVSLRKFGAPGVEALTGSGIYYGAANTEAVLCTGEHVVVVGGANSAGQGAMFLSRYAEKVSVLVRGDSLETKMSQYLIEQFAATENIEVSLQTEVVEAHGDGRLESLTIRNNATGETENVPTAAMFVFIGAAPFTDMVADVVRRNDHGFIPTGQDLVRDGQRPDGWRPQRDPFMLETSVPGIFAAGDVREGVIRRVASAVGQGSVAVSLIYQYLETV
jgi:thioredoxin reductase (NADPH)